MIDLFWSLCGFMAIILLSIPVIDKFTDEEHTERREINRMVRRDRKKQAKPSGRKQYGVYAVGYKKAHHAGTW